MKVCCHAEVVLECRLRLRPDAEEANLAPDLLAPLAVVVRVSGNEGLGLAGLCLRLRVDWRKNMAMLLMATGIRGSHIGSITHHPVVVGVFADFAAVWLSAVSACN